MHFVRFISHQLSILFSQNKSATGIAMGIATNLSNSCMKATDLTCLIPIDNIQFLGNYDSTYSLSFKL
jgi:hypothetical protein